MGISETLFAGLPGGFGATLAIGGMGGDWFWGAMTSRLALFCLAVMALCVVLLAAGLTLIWRIGAAEASRRRTLLGEAAADGVAASQGPLARLASDCQGTAVIEFVMVLPIVLFVSLVLAQTTMLMAGNLYVHYSAFAATRSAVVQIPTYDSPVEPRNVIVADDNSFKYQQIHRAASMALLPASGRLNSGGGFTGDDVSNGMQQYFSAYNRSPPQWMGELLADRVRYAMAYTELELQHVRIEDGRDLYFDPVAYGDIANYNPNEPVTVSVRHELHLSVPYVRRLFADGEHATTYGDAPFTMVSAQFTLTNEGVSPDLPPTPPYPRRP